MKVRDEINKFSSLENKEILQWLFDRYHWDYQWRFVATCIHEKYGVHSYMTNRIWSPTKEGFAIYSQLSKTPAKSTQPDTCT